MSKKKAPKKLTITTIEELCNAATPENYDRLILDLRAFLAHATAATMLFGEAKCVAFIWTDDGEHVITGMTMTRPKIKVP